MPWNVQRGQQMNQILSSKSDAYISKCYRTKIMINDLALVILYICGISGVVIYFANVHCNSFQLLRSALEEGLYGIIFQPGGSNGLIDLVYSCDLIL